jgi:hypothetical protein
LTLGLFTDLGFDRRKIVADLQTQLYRAINAKARAERDAVAAPDARERSRARDRLADAEQEIAWCQRQIQMQEAEIAVPEVGRPIAREGHGTMYIVEYTTEG